MFDIGLYHFVILSFIMLSAGIATVLSKRNAIGILMGVELIINAAALNLVAFNYFLWHGLRDQPLIDGMMFAIFVIVLAAAEAAVALGIILNYYNSFSTVDVERADQMQG